MEKELDRTIDRTSMDYAWFVTHIRFMIERIVKNNKLNNELADILLDKFPNAYELAVKSEDIVKEELDIPEISKDELAFITMHIERFL